MHYNEDSIGRDTACDELMLSDVFHACAREEVPVACDLLRVEYDMRLYEAAPRGRDYGHGHVRCERRGNPKGFVCALCVTIHTNKSKPNMHHPRRRVRRDVPT